MRPSSSSVPQSCLELSDFVHCRPDDGRPFRTFNIIEEYSRECLVIKIERRLNSTNVIDALTVLFILFGPHTFALDNGPVPLRKRSEI